MKMTTKNLQGNTSRTLVALFVLVAMVTPVAFAEVSGSSATTYVIVDSNADADVDGLLDAVEAALGCNPALFDTDGDGMDDGYEVWNALDPNQASDANQDPDGDGLKNLDEYHIGSMAFINDSDGDGFWDNVEFTRDTDATDSTDFPIRSVGADVDANGTVNAVDVQLVVNGALGMTTSVPTNVDNTGGVNALDVQQVINAAVR